MKRIIIESTYSGNKRTATITEETTLAEDLAKLSMLLQQLSGVESRFETVTETYELEYLNKEKVRLNAEIAEMNAAVAGYTE